MLRPITKITLTQKSSPFTSDEYPAGSRDKQIIFDFVSEGDIEQSWENMTETCTIKLPKNIYFTDVNGNRQTWTGQSIIIGTNLTPLVTRGDAIKIELGYEYESETQAGEYTTETNVVFEGYITKVSPRMPIVLTAENNIFLCKRTHITAKTYSETDYTTETMLQDLIKQVNANFKLTGTDALTVKMDNVATKCGDFVCSNTSMAEVLDELKKNYHMVIFFRGNELRAGYIRYWQDSANSSPWVFHFQKNIQSDNLEYMRAEDIRIGIKAYSIDQVELSETNKDGSTKKKHDRLEATVGDSDGEIRTLYFWNVKTTDDLKAAATKKLRFFKISHLTGEFTAFVLPQVKHGDIVELQNNVIPEFAGKYFVKSVKTEFGRTGHKQIITPDLHIDTLSKDDLAEYNTIGI